MCINKCYYFHRWLIYVFIIFSFLISNICMMLWITKTETAPMLWVTETETAPILWIT